MSDNPLMTALHTWRHTGAPGGTIGYAGYLPGRDLLWSRQTPVADLPPTDWTPTAAVLRCLTDPTRLAALADLLAGRGPLPAEHVAPLEAAGLITRRHTGEHDIAPQAAVPLLTILAAATNIATDTRPAALR
ncbi:hypothetical protein [Actinoplanes sp. NPDC049265]|uniref:hypothetical protein n=1 Tax=Actinoplanes sp. NPDC049265 TaxID=3363902 RepID=UPI00371CA573